LSDSQKQILAAEERDCAMALWRHAGVDASTRPDLVCFERRTPVDDLAVANVAIAMEAGLTLLEISPEDSDHIMREDQTLQSADPRRGVGAGREISRRLTPYHQALDLGRYETVTFVAKSVPHGLVAPVGPVVCHVPRIMDLARIFANAVMYETQEGGRTYTAVILDPGFFPVSESVAVNDMLRGAGWRVKRLDGAQASYEGLDLHLQFYPHDVLLLVSHGGEVPGRYNVFRFRDINGAPHQFECEEAVAFSFVGPDDKVLVSTLTVPVRVDGYFWDTEEARAGVNPGDVLRRYVELHRSDLIDQIELLASYDLPNVRFSNAVMVHGGRTHQLAVNALGLREDGIVFNNSCSSWAEIGKRVLFAGARGYICTARPVNDQDAVRVATGFFERALVGTPLATALRESALAVPSVQGVYIYVGLPFSTLHSPQRVDIGARWKARVIEIARGIARLDRGEAPDDGRRLDDALAFLRRVFTEV
jgi:hypothetical protein